MLDKRSKIPNLTQEKRPDDIVAFNLKIKRKDRRTFKENAKSTHCKTMQEVLSAFILSYNNDPYKFNIQTVLRVKNNGPISREPEGN